MNQENKNRTAWGLKVLALAIFFILTVAVCSGVWSYCPEPWVKWCAIALLVVNGYTIIRIGKTLNKSDR